MTETAQAREQGGSGGRPNSRTAIVFVHGQGEQRPMQSVRDLVRTVWRTDPHLSEARRRTDKTPTGPLRAWSTPDEDGEIYELRRISTEAPTDAEETLDGAEERRRFDFYEYYWAHLIEGTRVTDLVGWVKEIFAKPVDETPATIRPIRIGLERFTEVLALFAVAFATLTAALVFRAGPTPGLGESFEIARQTLEVKGLLAAIDPINSFLGQAAFGLIPIFVLPLSLLVFVLRGDRPEPPPRAPSLQSLRAQAKDRERPLANVWMYWTLGVVAVFLAALSVEPSSQILAAVNASEAPPILGVELRFLPFVLAIGASIYAIASAGHTVARLWLLAGVALLLGFFAQGVDGRVQGALSVLSFLVLTFAWRRRRLEAIFLAIATIAACLVARIALRDAEAVAAAEFSETSKLLAPLTWAYVYGFGVALFTLVPTADRPFGARAWWLAVTVALAAAGASLTMLVGAQDVNRLVAPWSDLFTPGPPTDAFSAYSIVLLHDSMSTVVLLCAALFAVAAWAARDSFLLPVLGDSARYLRNTPRNVERRQRIRRQGVELLERLHDSGKYDRIVVVGHSLGSVVGYDILSHLWGRRVDALHAPDCEAALRETEAAARRLVLRAAPDLAAPAEALAKAIAAAGAGPGGRVRARWIDPARADLAHERGREATLAALDGLGLALRFCRGAGAKAAREAADHLIAGPARYASAAGALEAFAAAQGTNRGRRGALAEAAQAASTALSEAADAFAAWRDAQSRYAAALAHLSHPRRDAAPQKPWLVTDFVTLGSPLHFGAWLFAQTTDEFAARKLDREVLTNPPFLDLEPPRDLARGARACFSHVRDSATPDVGGTGVFGPSHGALFAAVRWTNLFFRTRHILAGDIIGGPLWRHFDFGVADMPLDRAETGRLFAHNEYWRSDLDDAALRADAPNHIEALRAALDLARPRDGGRTPAAPGRAIIAQLRQHFAKT